MAADGSLTFDTKINTDGFDGGISTLTKAMDRLTKAVDGLSSNILNRFNGAGQAMAETARSAESTSDAVGSVGDAADKPAGTDGCNQCPRLAGYCIRYGPIRARFSTDQRGIP